MSIVGASGVSGCDGESHGCTPEYGPGSFLNTLGDCVIDSVPPATTTVSIPARMFAAAVCTAAMPDAQWRLCAMPGTPIIPSSIAT